MLEASVDRYLEIEADDLAVFPRGTIMTWEIIEAGNNRCNMEN